MNYFLKDNKNFLTYSLIILIVIPIFGFNFFISFLGNILLLLLLIPLLLLVLVFIGFNSYKSKINICSNCGAKSLGLNDTCMNCGANLKNKSNNNQPRFGFVNFAETWNGRMAMMGILIGLGTELITGQSILRQIGIG